MSIWKAARIAAAAMLFLALFEMPDEYYKALRFVVTAAAIMEIYQLQKGNFSQGKKTAWTLAFAAVAIVFNPLMPLEMEREAWAVFDVVGAGIFAFQGFGLRAASGVISVCVLAIFLVNLPEALRKKAIREHWRRMDAAHAEDQRRANEKKQKDDEWLASELNKLPEFCGDYNEQKLKQFLKFLDEPRKLPAIGNRQAMKFVESLTNWERRGIESSDPKEQIEAALERDSKRLFLIQWEIVNNYSTLLAFGVPFDREIEIKAAKPLSESELRYRRRMEQMREQNRKMAEIRAKADKARRERLNRLSTGTR